MQQLEGGARVGQRGVGRVAPGPDEDPVAARRPQPLPAGVDQVRHRVDHAGQVLVDGDPAPALVGEEAAQPGFGGGGGDGDRRGGHGPQRSG